MAVSPDGLRLAFVWSDSDKELTSSAVNVIQVGGREPEELLKVAGPESIDGLAWTPDGGDLIFARSRSTAEAQGFELWRISAEGGKREKVGVAAESIRRMLGDQRMYVVFTGILGALALLLAATGVYGVISHSASQRTHEIGIRMALGAGSRQVLGLIIKQSMLSTLVGVTIGTGAAFALTRLVASRLHGVSATDPVSFGGAAFLLVAVSVAASYMPARRASKVDPLTSLRAE